MASEGFDGVLHFAALALVSESVAHPERYYRTNVGGTLNLLDAMRAARSRVSCSHPPAPSTGSPRRFRLPKRRATRPANAYGASKLAVDRMIADDCLAHRLGAVSLRYFNVAGASRGLGEDHEPETHLIPNVLRAAQGAHPFVEVFGTDYPTPDGTAIRDYIHIDDLAAAHLLALDATREGEHRIFNLGNGSGFSVREVIATAEQVTGRADRHARFAHAEPATRRSSSRRAIGSAASSVGHHESRLWRTWSPTPGRSRRLIPMAMASVETPERPRLPDQSVKRAECSIEHRFRRCASVDDPDARGVGGR